MTDLTKAREMAESRLNGRDNYGFDVTAHATKARADIIKAMDENVAADLMEKGVQLTGSLIAKAVGQENGVDFIQRRLSISDPTTSFFLGSGGMEKTAKPRAIEVHTGWSVANDNQGAQFSIKGVNASGDSMVLALNPNALAVVIEEAVAALDLYRSGTGKLDSFLGEAAAKAYDDLLSALATEFLNTEGAAARIRKDARAEAELTIEAHAIAADRIAMDRAEKKVETLVRSLAQAVAMTPGLERSLALEACQPMIKRAFGGEE